MRSTKFDSRAPQSECNIVKARLSSIHKTPFSTDCQFCPSFSQKHLSHRTARMATDQGPTGNTERKFHSLQWRPAAEASIGEGKEQTFFNMIDAIGGVQTQVASTEWSGRRIVSIKCYDQYPGQSKVCGPCRPRTPRGAHLRVLYGKTG